MRDSYPLPVLDEKTPDSTDVTHAYDHRSLGVGPRNGLHDRFRFGGLENHDVLPQGSGQSRTQSPTVLSQNEDLSKLGEISPLQGVQPLERTVPAIPPQAQKSRPLE